MPDAVATTRFRRRDEVNVPRLCRPRPARPKPCTISNRRMLCEHALMRRLDRRSPLEFIVLNGKLTLYCLKEGAAQLPRTHGVSLSIVSMHQDDSGLFTVHVRARTVDRREDEDVGVVTLPAGGEQGKCGDEVHHQSQAAGHIVRLRPWSSR